MEPGQAVTATNADTPTALLSYDGQIGEFYRIFLVNLLQTIVTLGIGRFWATTRTRRYLWSRSSVQAICAAPTN